MYKIAICDDDKRYRKTIREIIEHENSLPENEIRFYEYESGNELLKHTDILHELVFIDIRMPGLDGNQTAIKLRNYNKDAVLIFYSSYFEPTVDSINFGQPFRYIMKDFLKKFVDDYACNHKICVSKQNIDVTDSNYCSYCSSWVQRAIIYNGEQVEKWIDNCREFEKALDRSEVFRSVRL